jgi:aryl-alcohol dehydrogenase-like predicted oxidoreductase
MDQVRLGATGLHVSRLLHKPGVTAPIVGATKMGHLEDAIAAADLSLSDEEIARLEEPYVPHPVRGHG